jgi:Flp pilus assembly protein TadD
MDDLATVATAQGRYAEAIRFRKQVLELAPGEARYYLNLGMTYSWAGNDREADQAFAEAVRLSPNLEQHILEKRAEILEKRKLMRRERR